MRIEPAVILSVSALTNINLNISKKSEPNAIIFYLKHHCGKGKVAIGFGSDRIRTLVSMATESSHLVKIEKMLLPLDRLHL